MNQSLLLVADKIGWPWTFETNVDCWNTQAQGLLKITIVTPSFNQADFVEQLMGGQDNKYNFHYTVLNRVNLSRILVEVGFVNVREWVPGDSDLTTFDDFSVYKKEVAGNKYEISLNIEANK